jgi:hypothetical protein
VTTVVIDNPAVKNACTDGDAERRAPTFFGHQDCDG